MTYEQFRTGLTFRDVHAGLVVEARNVFAREGRRMFITRHTVLGRWRQIKLASWEAARRAGGRRLTVTNQPEADTWHNLE